MRKILLASVSLMALAACDLSPDFKLPDFSNAPAFKEADTTAPATVEPATDGSWKRFDDKARLEEIAWWRMFRDANLDALEEQAMKDNPSLEMAQQRVVSAQAQAEAEGATLFPEVSLGAGPVREKLSPASINASAPPGFKTTSTKPYTLYTVNGTITYELDLFGKNRNTARAAEHEAEGEESNYRAARLSLQAEVAQAYFTLASLRMESDVLTKTIATRQDSLKLIQKKRDVGEIDDLQVSAAETDLANAQSDAAAIAQQVALQEHLLATLVGTVPAQFQVMQVKLVNAPPIVPAGLPSALLERRPDIKVAAKEIAAANARIGVARAGYFPDISISAMGGFTSGALHNLFDWSNRTWLIGPLAGTVITQPIFEGGRIAAARAQSDADYASAVAGYRGSVLQAFREVEDQLSGLHYLSDQATASDTALRSAKRAYDIASARYKVGYSSYLEYLDAQRSLLAAERANVQVMGNRYITTVQLVKALGGSWQAMSTTATAAPTAPVATQPQPAPAPTGTPPETHEWWEFWNNPEMSSEPAAGAPAPTTTETPAAAAPIVAQPTEAMPPAELPVEHTDSSSQSAPEDTGAAQWWEFWKQPDGQPALQSTAPSAASPSSVATPAAEAVPESSPSSEAADTTPEENSEPAWWEIWRKP